MHKINCDALPHATSAGIRAAVTGVIVLPAEGEAGQAHTSIWGCRIGGLPLLLRQARLLRAVGVDNIAVLARADRDDSLLDIVRSGNLGVGNVRFVSLADLEGADCLVLVRADWVLQRSAVAAALQVASRATSCAVFVWRGRLAGLAVATHERLAHVLQAIDRAGEPAGSDTGLAALHPLVAADAVGPVRGPADLVRAEDELWRSCRKPVDGIVSRHLNRYLSLAVSRRIAASGISPNQISLLNLFLGIVAAALVAAGSYWPVLAGAVLFQVNSILDGVDGELARVRLQTSVLGEWLDTLSDDLSNLAFFAGLGYGAWRQTGAVPWLWLTLATVIGVVAVAAVYYHRLRRMRRGDVLAVAWFQPSSDDGGKESGLIDRLVVFGTAVARKDLLVFAIMVAAFFGLAPFFLVIACIAAWATFVAQIFLLPPLPPGPSLPSSDDAGDLRRWRD